MKLLIDSVAAGELSLRPDYSHEVHSHKNTDIFDCSLFVWAAKSATSLYYYNGNGKLDARFKLDFKKEPVRLHWYEELPNHFLGTLSVPKKNCFRFV